MAWGMVRMTAWYFRHLSYSNILALGKLFLSLQIWTTYNSLLRDYSLKRGEDNRIVVLLQPWLMCLVTPAWPLAPPGPGHQCSQALTTPSSGVMIIINTFSMIVDRDPVKINCTQPFSERLFAIMFLAPKELINWIFCLNYFLCHSVQGSVQ